jgi:glycosyltransferase 2 family protein
MTKRYALEFLKILIAGSIITWLLMSGKIDLYAIRYVFTFESILLCWGIVFFTFFLVSIRWQLLLESQGIKVSTKDSVRMSLIGSFFSFVLPGGVSGDAVKAYYVSKDNKDKQWTSGVSVIVDRYIGVTTLCFLAFFVTLIEYKRFSQSSVLASLQTFLAIMLVFLIVSGYLIFSKTRFEQLGRLFRRLDIKFGQKARTFFAALNSYGQSHTILFKAFILSLIGHVSTIYVFSHLGHRMGEYLPLEAYFYCVPISIMLSSVPIAPGGIGVGQAAFYFVFNLYLGRVSDLGPTLVTIYQMIIFSYSVVGAIFYLQLKRSTDFNQVQSAEASTLQPTRLE